MIKARFFYCKQRTGLVFQVSWLGNFVLRIIGLVGLIPKKSQHVCWCAEKHGTGTSFESFILFWHRALVQLYISKGQGNSTL